MLNNKELVSLLPPVSQKALPKRPQKKNIIDLVISTWDDIIKEKSMSAPPQDTSQSVGGDPPEDPDDSFNDRKPSGSGDGDDSDSSEPEGDFDPFGEEDGSGFITVGVKLTFEHKRHRPSHVFNLFVKPSWEAKSIAYMMASTLKLKTSFQVFHKFNGSDVFMNLSIIENGIRDLEVLTLSIRARGGGLIRKSLTKQEALLKLKSKARSFATNDDEPYDVNTFNQSFRDYMNIQIEQVNGIKLMINQGNDVVKLAVRNVSDEHLTLIHQLMSKKYSGKDDTSESRVVQTITYLFPTLEVVASSSKALSSLHGEMLSFLMEHYTEKFSVHVNGEARYDHKPFIRMLEAEQGRRVNLTEAGVVISPAPQSHNCIVS